MAIRVVMDTNVLIAALRSGTGASAEVLTEIQRGSIEIQLSVPLYFQYLDVISRHVSELRYSDKEIGRILAYLCDGAGLHSVYFLVRPSSVDVRDDMVLEVAVKARAEYIVTHNVRHFGEAEKHGVVVVKPIQLLHVIGAYQ